ncbi:hypothetical protein CP083_06445 [Candidatus Bathyarchaeota archaeon B24-2]|nr:MAG: hypothetical protein CP083_06445 [Candidatus Bathyarchaeota archaeon B24-2]
MTPFGKRINFNMFHLFVVSVVVSLTSEAINAFFPLFLQSLGATVMEVGLILTASGLVSTMMMVPSGFLADRYGKKTIIVLSLILSASTFLCSIVRSWVEIIPIAVLFTTASAIFIPARTAVIADQTDHKNRAMVYGLMNVSWPVGGIIGPILAGFLADRYGWNEVFYFVTAFSIASLFPAFKLKEPKTPSIEGEAERITTYGVSSREVNRVIAVHTAITLLNGIARGVISPIVPFYLTDKLQLNKTELGLFLSLSYGISVIVTQPLSGLLANRVGSKELLILGSLLSPVAMAVFPLFDGFLPLFVVYMLQFAFWSVSWPTSITLLVGAVPPSKRGFASAVRTTGFRLGFYAGPMIGAYLWESVSPASPFYGAAFFLALAVPFTFIVKKP